MGERRSLWTLISEDLLIMASGQDNLGGRQIIGNNIVMPSPIPEPMTPRSSWIDVSIDSVKHGSLLGSLLLM